jgi:murein DD-endopeptidase MepM/ murein hydrolase activator NlpD
MIKTLRVVFIIGLLLAFTAVSAQGGDWWAWVYTTETDSLLVRSSGGVQFELPRPRLPSEAGTAPALISVTPDGRTLIIAAETADNRTEIGFYNIAARAFVRTHLTQPGEFISTSAGDAAIYNPAGDQAAIALSSESGAWRVILFQTATGDALETLTSGDSILETIGLAPAPNALVFIVGFAGEEIWLEQLVPGEFAELTPFVWLPEQDTVGVSEFYGLADSLLNGSLVFPYLDVTQPALDLPNVQTPYNTLAVLEGGEIEPIWLDQTRVQFAAQWVAGGSLVAYQAGVPDQAARWYLLPLTDADLIPLPEEVEWVYGTPNGLLSVTAEGIVSYHDIEAPAQPQPAFTLAPDERIVWTLTEADLNFDLFSLTGQSGPIPPTPTPCILRSDWFTYTVVRGDTLGSIARRAGSTIAELAAGNCLANVNIIFTGQTLYVPNIPATPTPVSVQIVAFNVTPATAQPGQTVTMSWETRGTTAVALNLSSPDGFYRQSFANLPPTGSQSYTVPQVFAGGVPAFIRIELAPTPSTGFTPAISLTLQTASTPEIISFSASAATARPGDTISLNWEVRNAQGVTIQVTDPLGAFNATLNNLAATGGTPFVIPQVFAGGLPPSLTFTLAPVPDNGARRAVTVTLASPQIISFELDGTPAPGQNVTLTWQVLNAQSVSVRVLLPNGAVGQVYDNQPLNGGLVYTFPAETGSYSFQLVPQPDTGLVETLLVNSG